jgi:hypothetical protein
MKLFAMVFPVVLLSAAIAGPRIAAAQATFSVCIGEGGVWWDGSGCPANMNYYFDCTFAHAHPEDTEKVAADLICLTYKAYKRAGYERKRSYDGHNCGYILTEITCQN